MSLSSALSVGVTLALCARARRAVHARRVRARLRPTRQRPTRQRLLLSALRPRRQRRNSASGASQVSAGALATLLDDVARRCATGESLTQAFVTAPGTAALAPTFDATIAEIKRGATLVESLRSTPLHNNALALAVHVLILCSRVGGNVSESLDRAAATLREREAMVQERIAQSAQARLSARVLTLVPLAFAGWTTLTSPRVRAFTFSTTGAICLCLGLILNVTGSRVMRRLIGGHP